MPHSNTTGAFEHQPLWPDNESEDDSISLLDITDPDESSSSMDGDVAAHNGAATDNKAELTALLSLMSRLKMGTGTMPMPSSRHAPQFRGRNLRAFLDDYNIATKGAGWNDAQKCKYLHTYCSRNTRELVRKLNSRSRNDWNATVRDLLSYYHAEDRPERYTRDNLDKFIRKTRTISNKKHFTEYYREFCRRVQGLKEGITQEDVNRLFWKGIPKDVRTDVFSELRVRQPTMNKRIAPEIGLVRKIALTVLDKDSVFADLAVSHSRGKSKQPKEKKTDKPKRQHKSMTSKALLESSDEETSDSNNSSSESDSESEHSSSESDSDSSSSDSESDHEKRRKSHKSSKRQKTKVSKRKETKKRSAKNNIRPKKEVDLGLEKDSISDIAHKLQEIQLMLGHTAKLAKDEEFMRDTKLDHEPSNKRILNVMEQIVQDFQGSRNETHIERDRRFLVAKRGGPATPKCFFCQKFDTHPRGTRNCPDAQALVQEGVCTMRDGRVYMADGSELPRMQQGETMTMAIRNQNMQKNPGPAIRNNLTRTPRVAFAKVLGPDEADSDGYKQEPMGANPALWQNVFAADRVEKPERRASRFNPIDQQKRIHWQDKRGNQSVKPRMRPYVEVSPPPKQWPKSPNAGPGIDNSNTSPIEQSKTIAPSMKDLNQGTQPARPRPFNKETRQQVEPGEKGPVILKRQPNIQKSDFIMRSDPRVPNPGPEKTLSRNPPKSRFTTAIRKRFEAKEVYDRILNAAVTVPLGELLAVSPEMERTLSNETKVHSVPVTQPTDQDFDGEMVDAFPSIYYEQDQELSDDGGRYEFPGAEYTEMEEEDEFFTPFTTQAFIAQGDVERNRKGSPPISPTVSFSLQIGHLDGVVAMVDSGAEMNMVTPELAEELRNHYAEDEQGRQYRMKNVSGVVENLQGKFDRIPCAVGGATFEETFFVGGPWNSNFSAILGQTFLQNNACQLSWNHEGSNRHVIMRMQPNGDPDRGTINVRLNKDYQGRMRFPAQANMAQIEFHNPPDASDEDIAIGPDFQNGSSSSNSTNLDADQETIQHTEDELSAEASDEDDIWGDASSTEPEQDSYPATGQTSMTSEGIEAKGKLVPIREDHETAIVNISQFETIVLPTGQNSKLDIIYNTAVNDLRRRIKPSAQDLDPQTAAKIYDRLRCRIKYEIPIGDGLLNITEGEQIFRIRRQIMRATMDPTALYNLITPTARQRAGLIIHEVPGHLHSALPTELKHITIHYCANVPIEIEEGPPLPGVFLVVQGPLPDGVDMVIAVPWLMGIIKRYEGYRFSEPGYSPPTHDDVILPYKSDLDAPPDEGSSMESLTDLNCFMAMNERTGIPLQKNWMNRNDLELSWVEITDTPWKRRSAPGIPEHDVRGTSTRTRRRDPQVRVPPAILGGSFAKTL